MTRRPENVVENLLSFAGVLFGTILLVPAVLMITGCASITELRPAVQCYWNAEWSAWSNEPTPDLIAEDHVGCS